MFACFREPLNQRGNMTIITAGVRRDGHRFNWQLMAVPRMPIPTTEYVGHVAADSSQPCVRVGQVEFGHLDAESLRFFVLDWSGEIRPFVIREPRDFVRSVDNSKNCAFTFLRCGSRHVL